VIKIIIAGIWACVVALGASFLAVSWQGGAAPPPPAQAAKAPDKGGHGGGLETVRTRMISVPVIRSGGVQGYVMAQFSFSGEAKALKYLPVKADVIVIDEAFKAIYSEESVDFRNLKKQDLPELGKRITEASNKRLGSPVIADIFVQELNYVSKEGIRAGGNR
jgi:hypothetical protein